MSFHKRIWYFLRYKLSFYSISSLHSFQMSFITRFSFSLSRSNMLIYPTLRRGIATQTSNGLTTDTSQLNHPNVMPVLDTSQLSEAEQIYVRRFEEGHMRNVE